MIPWPLQPAAEGTFEEIDVSDSISLLSNGENVIAVEVHQTSPGSSDLSFDLDLTATDSNSDDTALIERRSLWRYDDSGVDRGPSDQDSAAAWFGSAFDDSAWNAGLAELGYGDGDGTEFATSISFGSDPERKFITTYFRKGFTVDETTLASLESLQLTIQRDDGALVYLNGTEVVRDNLEDERDRRTNTGTQ